MAVGAGVALYALGRWLAEDVVWPFLEIFIDPFKKEGTGGLRLGWGVVGILVLGFGLVANSPVAAVVGLVIVCAMIFAQLRVRRS